jgi:hypothetical protein
MPMPPIPVALEPHERRTPLRERCDCEQDGVARALGGRESRRQIFGAPNFYAEMRVPE